MFFTWKVRNKCQVPCDTVIHSFFYINTASVFFFISFSYACYVLHDAVDLSKVSSPLRAVHFQKRQYFVTLLLDRRSLIAANVSFQILVVSAIVDCLMASSLSQFFKKSISYKILTYVEAAKNLIYGGSLLYYSLTLRSKLITMVKDISSWTSSAVSVQEAYVLRKLQRSLRKLMWVMVFCFISFTIRFLMLLLKSFVVENNSHDPFYWMPPYG